MRVRTAGDNHGQSFGAGGTSTLGGEHAKEVHLPFIEQPQGSFTPLRSATASAQRFKVLLLGGQGNKRVLHVLQGAKNGLFEAHVMGCAFR